MFIRLGCVLRRWPIAICPLLLSLALATGVPRSAPRVERTPERPPVARPKEPSPELRTSAVLSSRAQPQPRLYVTRTGDTFWGIARLHSTDVHALMAANPTYAPERLPIGVCLRLPAGGAVRGPAETEPHWSWPVNGRISSRYGWRWGRMHRGLDIAAPAGSIVRAAGQGRVVFAGWRAGYGLLVILAHDRGWQTAYAHNSCLFVRNGQWVPAGGALARVGATGNATGIHLHFEVTAPGGHIDPLRVLP